MTINLHPSIAVHPGTWLLTEIVEPQNLSVNDVADKMCVTAEFMSDLLGGRAALSLKMATQFETVFSVSADTSMRMQATYDFAHGGDA